MPDCNFSVFDYGMLSPRFHEDQREGANTLTWYYGIYMVSWYMVLWYMVSWYMVLWYRVLWYMALWYMLLWYHSVAGFFDTILFHFLTCDHSTCTPWVRVGRPLDPEQKLGKYGRCAFRIEMRSVTCKQSCPKPNYF